MKTLHALIKQEGIGAIGTQRNGAKRYLAYNDDKGWYLTKEYNLFWRVCRYTLGLFFGSFSPLAETHSRHLLKNKHNWLGEVKASQLEVLNRRVCRIFVTNVIRPKVPSGIKNGGNTCWLNATLQVLLSSEKVQKALKSKESTPTKNILRKINALLPRIGKAQELKELVLQLRDIFKDDPEVSNGHVDPTNTFSRILQELGLGEHTLRTKSTPERMGCVAKWNEAPNTMLDVCVDGEEERVNLSSLLHKFRDKSEGDGTLAFEARNRVVKSRYTQEYYLGEPIPELLPVCFKRFTYKDGKSVRLDTKVDIDKEVMDLGFLTEKGEKAEFRLKGAVVHSGGVNGGHYVAYVKNDQGHWLCCDDSKVSVSDISEIDQGYIYLFEKI